MNENEKIDEQLRLTNERENLVQELEHRRFLLQEWGLHNPTSEVLLREMGELRDRINSLTLRLMLL